VAPPLKKSSHAGGRKGENHGIEEKSEHHERLTDRHGATKKGYEGVPPDVYEVKRGQGSKRVENEEAGGGTTGRGEVPRQRPQPKT